MTAVVLVRHAMPEVRRGVSSRLWALGERGREDCVLLAHALTGPLAPVVFSSDEPKARETAAVTALRRGLRPAVDARFGEVDRPQEWVEDHAALARRYLAGEPLPGWEPHGTVVARFAGAIADAVTVEGGGDVVVATHGMAMTLWASAVAGIADPVRWWEALTFPDAWRVDPRAGTLEHLYLGGTTAE